MYVTSDPYDGILFELLKFLRRIGKILLSVMVLGWASAGGPYDVDA